ncbi:MAG: hypothetical protein HY930_04945 [Euryarchaeota archaeon]|nr:hypothetical protein [Euryarchaeota archaeon]
MRIDLHNCRIIYTKHCRRRFIQRFLEEQEAEALGEELEQIKHVIRTGKVVKLPEKDGSVGVIEKRIRKGKFRVKFTYYSPTNTLAVLTIEK